MYKQFRKENLVWVKMMEAQRPIPKSSVISESRLKTGNEMFKKREFEKALDSYNESLCYAPPGSLNIALAYRNRSAVYSETGRYALAIENIKMARENGFPPEKMLKLDAREKKCEELKGKFGPDNNFDASSFFKLSHPPNKKIPFIIDCLELRQNKKYGRYIVTTRDLKTGDIIAIETPVISVLMPESKGHACAFCTKKNRKSLMPCPHCTEVMYCSEECLKKDAFYHYNNGFNKLYETTTRAFIKMQTDALRIADGLNELLELVKECENKTIFDFDLSNPDDPIYEKSMLIALNGLSRNVFFEENTEYSLDKDYLINQMLKTAEKRKQFQEYVVRQRSILFSNAVVQNGRAVIFLFRSLLNHSCVANVEYIMLDNKVVCIVNRPVKAGEQIFVNYGDWATTHTKKERQMILKNYQFKCDCEACFNNYPLQYPRKDPSFVEPNFDKVTPTEAIKQFKKNSEYIDKNAWKMPSYEVSKLINHNGFLSHIIAGPENYPHFNIHLSYQSS